MTHRKQPELASTYQEASIKETVMPNSGSSIYNKIVRVSAKNAAESQQNIAVKSCPERIAAEAHQNIAARANQK